MAQVELELAYDDVTVQYISHYATGTPPFIYLKEKYCQQCSWN